MLDRASTFAQPEIVKLLKTRFVPVAIDQANQRRQKDTEGIFFRKIAGQGPRNDFSNTTQGFYIATASGKLLMYNNNRDPEKVLRLMQEKLTEFDRDFSAEVAQSEQKASEVESASTDNRYAFQLPSGGLALRVHTKILGGYEPTADRWQRIFQTALARDNLWISPDEVKQLTQGTIADSLQRRIARFHLVDNTRGEPPMWKPSEIQEMEVVVNQGELSGTAKLSTEDGKRGFEAEMKGKVTIEAGAITRLDLVYLGEHWGDGPFTSGAPSGRFPMAVTFTLADGSDIADNVPPQGARGWLDGYMRP